MPQVERTEESQETKLPDHLRPYKFHGLDFDYSLGMDDVTCDCPWCGREGKFSIQVATGVWKCWSCGVGNDKGGGNVTTFLRLLWERSDTDTTDYSDLITDRRLLYPEILMHWGIARSVTTGDWIIPARDTKGNLQQVYRYLRIDGKMRLLPTPPKNLLGHQLFGSVNQDKPIVYVCEGPWDALALWEVLGQCKESNGSLVRTANPSRSLLSQASVVAVPGCNTFLTDWAGAIAGKEVRILYDSDHPRGKPPTCAGYEGAQRVASILLRAKTPPKEVSFLQWGPKGYDPDLPSGYDVRDWLTLGMAGGSEASPAALPQRIEALQSLLGRLCPVEAPSVGRSGRGSGKHVASKGGELQCTPCKSYKQLVQSWRRALKWTSGLDHALSSMLACTTSTKVLGDQLWIKVVGPPSSGKTTLAEGIAIAKEYVTAKSTIRGFHSGFREDGSDGEDNSLIATLYNKTLIIKDGDTLLQSPNLPQILSEARDLYDCTSRTHYRNKMSKDYEGVRMTIILCGTSSLRVLDQSELGERFLDCVLMEHIEDEFEDEVLTRVANRTDTNLAIESNGQQISHYPPDLREAMELTGGYVTYLRENAVELLGTTTYSDDAKHLTTRLAKFIAFMRARPSTKHDEASSREFASRLVSQLVRMGKCLAVVHNKAEVDSEVMQQLRRIALDTGRGQTLDMVAHLADNPEGLNVGSLAMHVSKPNDQTSKMLRFLKTIRVVDQFTVEGKGLGSKQRWRLTPRMLKLYHEVMMDQ